MATLRRLLGQLPRTFWFAFGFLVVVTGLCLAALTFAGHGPLRTTVTHYHKVRVNVGAQGSCAAGQTCAPQVVTKLVQVPVIVSQPDTWAAATALGSVFVGIGTLAVGAASLLTLRARKSRPEPVPKTTDAA